MNTPLSASTAFTRFSRAEVTHEQAREAGAEQSAALSPSRLSAVPRGAQWEPSRQTTLSLPSLQDVLWRNARNADGRGRRKISVVVDTSRMHFAKPVLAKFSAHPEQIELVTRPSSSPQLNPARRFWKHVRRKVTHTTFSRPLIDCLMRSLDCFVTWRLVHRPCARSPDEPRTSHQLLEIERTR